MENSHTSEQNREAEECKTTEELRESEKNDSTKLTDEQLDDVAGGNPGGKRKPICKIR